MSVGSRLRTGVLAFAMIFGALAGVSMTPEEIENAMSFENQPKTAYVLEEEDEAEKNRTPLPAVTAR
jgi:hypothetical protein